MLGLVFMIIMIGFIVAPELILMPIAIYAILAPEKDNQPKSTNNTANTAFRGEDAVHNSCSYEEINDEEYNNDEIGDDGFYVSSYDGERYETNSLDNLLSESDHSDDFSIYVNDSGLPTYWNDDGDIWGAPFG